MRVRRRVVQKTIIMIHHRTASHPYEEVPAILAAHGELRKRSPTTGRVEENSTVIIERLKNDIKEKDVQMLQLKQEVSILKILERRKQKELEDIEEATNEIPKQLGRLKEENQGLKAKIKQVLNGIAMNDRKSRVQDDLVHKLQKQLEENQAVLKDTDLLERSELQNKNELLEKRMHELEKQIDELQRKESLTEKNAATESKGLRHRVTQLELKQRELEDEVEKRNQLLKVRKDEIATLLVYKYNSIHRKTEQTCKTCAARKKQELDEKKRQESLSKLPHLKVPTVKVVSDTEALLSYKFPGFKYGSFDYTSAYMYYRELGSQSWHSVVLETLEAGGEKREDIADAKKGSKAKKRTAQPHAVLGSGSSGNLATAEFVESTFLLKQLTLGSEYELYVVASSEDLYGANSELLKFQFNLLNLPPAPPQCSTEPNPSSPSVKLIISPNGVSQGTKSTGFKIERRELSTRKSTPADFVMALGLQDAIVVDSATPSEITYYVDENVKNGFWYQYRVSATNSLGDSEPSDWAEPLLVDYAPEAPVSVQASVKTASSVQLSFSMVEVEQSPVCGFYVQVSGVRPVVHEEVFKRLQPNLSSLPAAQSVHASTESLCDSTAKSSAMASKSRAAPRLSLVEGNSTGGFQNSTTMKKKLGAKDLAEASASAGVIASSVTEGAGEAEGKASGTVTLATLQEQLKSLTSKFSMFEKEYYFSLEQVHKRRSSNGTLQFVATVANLTPGIVYSFRVSAKNFLSNGLKSEPLQDFELDYLPPKAEKPEVKLLSGTSFRLTIPPMQASVECPTIRGYRIYGARMNWPYSTFNRGGSAASPVCTASNASPPKGALAATGATPDGNAQAEQTSSSSGLCGKQLLRSALIAINPSHVVDWTVWNDCVSLDVNVIDINSLDSGSTYWLKYSILTEHAAGEASEPVMVMLSAALPLMPGQAAFKSSGGAPAGVGPAAISISLPTAVSTAAVTPTSQSGGGAQAQPISNSASLTSLSSLNKVSSASTSLASLNRGTVARAPITTARRSDSKLKAKPTAAGKTLPLNANMATDKKYKNMHEGNPALLEDEKAEFGTRQTRLIQRSKESLNR